MITEEEEEKKTIYMLKYVQSGPLENLLADPRPRPRSLGAALKQQEQVFQVTSLITYRSKGQSQPRFRTKGQRPHLSVEGGEEFETTFKGLYGMRTKSQPSLAPSPGCYYSVNNQNCSMWQPCQEAHKINSVLLSEHSSFASDFLIAEQEEQLLQCHTHFTDSRLTRSRDIQGCLSSFPNG